MALAPGSVIVVTRPSSSVVIVVEWPAGSVWLARLPLVASQPKVVVSPRASVRLWRRPSPS